MNKIAVFWDIENIHFAIGLEKLPALEYETKFFVHNLIHSPLKKDQQNYLLNKGWIFNSVKNKKNAADDKLVSLIEQNYKNLSHIVLITQDHGFAPIIKKLLKNDRFVILIVDGKEEKLLNLVFKGLSQKEMEFLTVL